MKRLRISHAWQQAVRKSVTSVSVVDDPVSLKVRTPVVRAVAHFFWEVAYKVIEATHGPGHGMTARDRWS